MIVPAIRTATRRREAKRVLADLVTLTKPRVLREGVIAGLIGAVVVALWFLLYDAWRGRPLFTPALLGTTIFYGVCTPASVQIGAGPVIGYTILHVLAFVGFGIVAACMMVASEREPAVFVAFVTAPTPP
jgi:hypothetical protein